MHATRLIPRPLMMPILAITLLPWVLGPTLPVRAADPPDARDPDRRIQIVLKSVYVSDDHDWGTGEMRARLRLYRTNDGCSPGQVEPPSCETTMASDSRIDFAANDGDNITLNRAIPATGPNTYVADPSIIGPEIGIPVWNHRFYRFSLALDEVDSFEESLGTASAVLSAANGWLLGTHTARGMMDAAGEPGDFSAEYEVRDARLPDLRPVDIKVLDAPGSTEKLVCIAVQNAGILDAGPFEVALSVDGVTPPNGRAQAGGLQSGQAGDLCVQMALSASGQHQLTAIVDEPRDVDEVSETNNRFTESVVVARVADVQGPLGQAPVVDPGVSTSPSTDPMHSTPSNPGQPDLAISAMRVNGHVPDGKADCKEGKNDVAVVVKNGGTANARDFVVRLVVDGVSGAAKEETVAELEPGKEREVHFDDVRLKKGERTLLAIADAEKSVAESNEQNNERKITASCKDG